MAITSDGNFGTGASGTAGTTLTVTPTATIAVGKIAIMLIAKDNTSAGSSGQGGDDRDGSETISITDTQSNTWKKCREYGNMQTTAATGVVSAVWKCKVTTQLTTSDTITINFSASTTDKAATLQVFSGVTNTLTMVKTSQNATDGAVGFGSVTISGITSQEYLWLRACAKEANSTTNPTPSTNFTAINTTRSRNNAAAVLVCGEFRINTSTSETSNPTLAVSGDNAACFIAFVDAAENTIQPALVQYACFGGSNNGTTLRNWPLPNTVLNNNTLIVFVQCANGQTPTVTDDKGGTYTLVYNANDGTNSQRMYCVVRTGITDSPTIVKVDPGAALGFISGSVFEYRNIDTVEPYETGSIAYATGTSITAATMVTCSDNALILSMFAEDSISPYATDQVVASLTIPTNFTERKMDRWLGEAVGERILATQGSSAPVWTSGTSRTFMTMQVSFRGASAGTAATILPRVIGVFHQATDYAGSHTSPFVLQIPWSGQGNAFYLGYIGLRNPGTVTDSQSNGWTATGAAELNNVGGNSGFVRCYYAFSPTFAAGSTVSIAFTGAGTGPGDTAMFYECIGINSFDSHVSSNSQSGTGTSYQLSSSITPTRAPGLVFGTVAQDSNTTLSVNIGTFIASTDPADAISPWPNDENNAWSVHKNPDLTAIQPTYTTDAAAGPIAWIQDSFSLLEFLDWYQRQSEPMIPPNNAIGYLQD